MEYYDLNNKCCDPNMSYINSSDAGDGVFQLLSMIQNVNLSFIIFKTFQHVKS